MSEDRNAFRGKVAFVTGGGTGIGRATALAFAVEGASVVVAGDSREPIEETAQLIEQAGGQALAVTCDVTSADDVKAALERTVEMFGRLDFAFNNAGVEQPVKPLLGITENDWDRLDGRQPSRCVPLHEARASADAETGRRRHREHVIRRRRERNPRAGRLCSLEVRRDRPDEICSVGLRDIEHPSERDLSRHHRYTDDGQVQRRH